jgi:hypothetical protein
MANPDASLLPGFTAGRSISHKEKAMMRKQKEKSFQCLETFHPTPF